MIGTNADPELVRRAFEAINERDVHSTLVFTLADGRIVAMRLY